MGSPAYPHDIPTYIVNMFYPNISTKSLHNLYGYGIPHREKFAWINGEKMFLRPFSRTISRQNLRFCENFLYRLFQEFGPNSKRTMTFNHIFHHKLAREKSH